MKILSTADIEQFDTFLLDASGVIYTDNGLVDSVSNVIRTLQKQGHVFLVTNNSYMYPTYIAQRLATHDIHFELDHIISSGFLKYDQTLCEFIKGKNVFLLGEETSAQYILDCGCNRLTTDLNQADVIVLAAFLSSYDHNIITDIAMHYKQYPNKPVICCNPDQYVVGQEGPYPVVGYYASQIEQQSNQKIHWFGKPFNNFSQIVAHILDQHNIIPNKKVVFFDDNLENVANMQAHIGITGCWVKDSGIGQYSDLIPKKLLEKKPHFTISSLTDLK